MSTISHSNAKVKDGGEVRVSPILCEIALRKKAATEFCLWFILRQSIESRRGGNVFCLPTVVELFSEVCRSSRNAVAVRRRTILGYVERGFELGLWEKYSADPATGYPRLRVCGIAQVTIEHVAPLESTGQVWLSERINVKFSRFVGTAGTRTSLCSRISAERTSTHPRSQDLLAESTSCTRRTVSRRLSRAGAQSLRHYQILDRGPWRSRAQATPLAQDQVRLQHVRHSIHKNASIYPLILKARGAGSWAGKTRWVLALPLPNTYVRQEESYSAAGWNARIRKARLGYGKPTGGCKSHQIRAQRNVLARLKRREESDPNPSVGQDFSNLNWLLSSTRSRLHELS